MVPSHPMLKKPRRINVTVPDMLFEELQERADFEGRSLSSLCAFLLESGLQTRLPQNDRR